LKIYENRLPSYCFHFTVGGGEGAGAGETENENDDLSCETWRSKEGNLVVGRRLDCAHLEGAYCGLWAVDCPSWSEADFVQFRGVSTLSVRSPGDIDVVVWHPFSLPNPSIFRNLYDVQMRLCMRAFREQSDVCVK
jgi:hypothetical protein